MIAVERQDDGAFQYHPAVENKSASRYTAVRLIQDGFPEVAGNKQRTERTSAKAVALTRIRFLAGRGFQRNARIRKKRGRERRKEGMLDL